MSSLSRVSKKACWWPRWSRAARRCRAQRAPGPLCGHSAAARHVPCCSVPCTCVVIAKMRAALLLYKADTPLALSYAHAQPKSYSQRRRAALSPVAQAHSPRLVTASVTSYVRLPRLRVPLRGESCLDSTSILEAARVELKRVLSRYKVPSPLLRRVCGNGARPKPLRPQCRRGGPNIARSPASIVCQRAALIIL